VKSAVGPVLQAGLVADAIVAAIRRSNSAVETIDRGSYVRVLAPGSCRVTRAAIEEQLRAPFRLPGDLERVMSSFQGHLTIDEEAASWIAPGEAP
jgi:hypothetical protein